LNGSSVIEEENFQKFFLEVVHGFGIQGDLVSESFVLEAWVSTSRTCRVMLVEGVELEVEKRLDFNHIGMAHF